MHIITYFCPKGGSGRTTAMMATASGLLLRNYSVAVLDLTEQARAGSVVRNSFISEWEDRMVESGVGGDQFTTVPAWDRESVVRALDRFRHEEFNFVLIDTARTPNPLILDFLGKSELVIVPLTGTHEAAYASAWLTTNRHPEGRVFGLTTGIGNDSDKELTRASFTGAPMMKSDLPRLRTFGTQSVDGDLFAIGFLRQVDPPIVEYRSHADLDDQTEATLATISLCREILHLINVPSRRGYRANAALASGSTFAHLNALLEMPANARVLN